MRRSTDRVWTNSFIVKGHICLVKASSRWRSSFNVHRRRSVVETMLWSVLLHWLCGLGIHRNSLPSYLSILLYFSRVSLCGPLSSGTSVFSLLSFMGVRKA